MHQREIRTLGETRTPQPVAPELVAACRHRLDAIRLCIQLSGYSQETICEQLGIDRGHLSRILSGRAYFPDTQTIELMQLCGNIAPLQFEAQTLGWQLSADGKAQRRAELLKELEQLSA